MGRKAKYSKEVKIKACKDYDKGDFTFNDIAKMIGTARSVQCQAINILNFVQKYILYEICNRKGVLKFIKNS